jgi:chromosome segregation ATPase
MKKTVPPINHRVEKLEETLETIVDNLDTWLKKREADLQEIRNSLTATIEKLDKLAGGGE